MLVSLYGLLAATVAGATATVPRSMHDVNLWRIKQRQAQLLISKFDSAQHPVTVQDARFDEHYFSQPLDHFGNTTEHTFGQRYWVNSRHYKAGSGGPVIVLDGGETSGEGRLDFLDYGIVDILAEATGGLGLVLEHRYYGKSIPVSNFSTDSLRWLNNAQSAADSANFMANVRFKGIDEDLTAPKTRWIYYGGSYAGARAAHMKILYPELVFGAIASSAVTHAAVENWEYFDVIRKAADPACSAHIENSIKTVDTLLKIPQLNKPLKSLFGLAGLEHDDDFVSVLRSPLGAWQSKNWQPGVGSDEFQEFCDALNKPPFGRTIGDFQSKTTLPGGLSLDLAVLNYASYIKEVVVSQCPEENVEDCFGTYEPKNFRDTGLDQDWRLWIFQVCTEWGYFDTAPPADTPSIISRLLTVEYESKICSNAFPPGKHFIVPVLPNVTVVNELGDFAIASDRLAFIDGGVDPWKPSTPHSDYAEKREDTILRPFKLIPNGVHHYDEYGLPNVADEPVEIQTVHAEMVGFVLEWLAAE